MLVQFLLNIFFLESLVPLLLLTLLIIEFDHVKTALKVLYWFPCVVTVRIADPFDQVLVPFGS